MTRSRLFLLKMSYLGAFQLFSELIIVVCWTCYKAVTLNSFQVY